jgi:hypothetical protein
LGSVDPLAITAHLTPRPSGRQSHSRARGGANGQAIAPRLSAAGGCTFTAAGFDDESKRASRVLDLLRGYVPATLNFEGHITDNDWRLVAPGLVGGAASIVESIFCLPPPRHAPSAEILTRSLMDYVITFAWLAVPDKRQERLNAFEESFYNESEGLDAKYTTEFQGKNQATQSRLGAAARLRPRVPRSRPARP